MRQRGGNLKNVSLIPARYTKYQNTAPTMRGQAPAKAKPTFKKTSNTARQQSDNIKHSRRHSVGFPAVTT